MIACSSTTSTCKPLSTEKSALNTSTKRLSSVAVRGMANAQDKPSSMDSMTIRKRWSFASTFLAWFERICNKSLIYNYLSYFVLNYSVLQPMSLNFLLNGLYYINVLLIFKPFFWTWLFWRRGQMLLCW